uniref:Secreted protein n=1 Tax=Anopheles darlingi TaxID=43151 RepID=A0A2M4DID6_ANODA
MVAVAVAVVLAVAYSSSSARSTRTMVVPGTPAVVEASAGRSAACSRHSSRNRAYGVAAPTSNCRTSLAVPFLKFRACGVGLLAWPCVTGLFVSFVMFAALCMSCRHVHLRRCYPRP